MIFSLSSLNEPFPQQAADNSKLTLAKTQTTHQINCLKPGTPQVKNSSLVSQRISDFFSHSFIAH